MKHDIPCSEKPFLHTKRIAGIGEQRLVNYNWGCAYTNRILVLVEGLDMFRLGLLLLVGGGSHQVICPLRKELWLDVCLWLNPERLGLH
jgi:hypothetical protein